jgi:hypothetical protein
MRLDSVPHSVLGPRSMVAQWRGKVSGGGGGGGTGVGSGLEGETRADPSLRHLWGMKVSRSCL